MSVAVKTPWAAVLDHLEAGFVMAIQQLIGDAARRSFICQLQSRRAKPLHADHGDGLLRQNASDGSGGLEVFKAGHVALRVTFPAALTVCLCRLPLSAVSSATYLSAASRTTHAI